MVTMTSQRHHIKTDDGNHGAWRRKFAVLHLYTHETRRQSHENPPGIGICIWNIDHVRTTLSAGGSDLYLDTLTDHASWVWQVIATCYRHSWSTLWRDRPVYIMRWYPARWVRQPAFLCDLTATFPIKGFRPTRVLYRCYSTSTGCSSFTTLPHSPSCSLVSKTDFRLTVVLRTA